MPVEGAWVDPVVGARRYATPDGHSRLERTKFRTPALVRVEPPVQPPNAFGLRRIMLAVDDLDDVVTRLEAQGGALVGAIGTYEDTFRRSRSAAIRRLATTIR